MRWDEYFRKRSNKSYHSTRPYSAKDTAGLFFGVVLRSALNSTSNQQNFRLLVQRVEVKSESAFL